MTEHDISVESEIKKKQRFNQGDNNHKGHRQIQNKQPRATIIQGNHDNNLLVPINHHPSFKRSDTDFNIKNTQTFTTKRNSHPVKIFVQRSNTSNMKAAEFNIDNDFSEIINKSLMRE